jgi:hypothetical protein
VGHDGPEYACDPGPHAMADDNHATTPKATRRDGKQAAGRGSEDTIMPGEGSQGIVMYC